MNQKEENFLSIICKFDVDRQTVTEIIKLFDQTLINKNRFESNSK